MPTSCIGPQVTLAPPARGSDVTLAAHLGIPVAPARDPATWQLVRTANRMQLCAPAAEGGLCLDLDLGNGPLARRIRQARRDDALPRACGLHRRPAAPSVLDATAGLCRDAMVLAHLGCTVTALERIPALAFLASAAIADTWLAAHLTVQLADSHRRLADWAAPAPAVVYLDPMFGEPGNAQVKKDMQICRALAGPPGDDGELLRLARRIASDRVVVKREAKAAPLAADVAFAVAGERVRFDVYLTLPPA